MCACALYLLKIMFLQMSVAVCAPMPLFLTPLLLFQTAASHPSEWLEGVFSSARGLLT